MFPRHILRVDQFQRPELDRLFVHTDEMRQVVERGGDNRLQSRILATLFFEPSTRTRLSFESAMLRLGGQIISSESAGITSSAAKGETIEDTVRIVESYADVVAIRHPVAGTSEAAAGASAVPILNAGDGAREHPTQALLDLFTIREELGRVDGLTVVLAGDLRFGRAARSLAMLLSETRDTRIILVAPRGIEMSQDVLATLRERGVRYDESPDLPSAMREADVVYMTRVQKERFPSEEEYAAISGSYRLAYEHLELLKPDAVVMHPLPRVDEIDARVDDDPRAAYFRQARNGVFIRMALLDLLLRPQAHGSRV